MKKLLFVLPLLCSVAVLMSSCGKKDEAVGGIAELQGTWKYCQVDDGFSFEEPPVLQTITVTGASISMSMELKPNADCTGNTLLSLKMSGTTSEPGGTSAVEGAKNLDFKVNSNKIKYFDTGNSSTNAGLASMIRGCAQLGNGVTVNPNQEYDGAAGGECGSIAGTTLYTIYKVDTTVTPPTLQLGTNNSDHDGSTAEKRHVELDHPLTKQ